MTTNFLVVGGTGRRVAERGLPVRITSRRGTPAPAGRSCGAAGSRRTSASTSSWTRVRGGEIALPAGTVTEPFVDVRDIADVAAKVLTEPGHTGQLYEPTGPRLLSFADAAADISAASGRDVRYVPVSAAEFAAGAAAQGVPEDEVGALVELFGRVLDGRNASLTTDVERVLGRPATDFADYARDAAATGVWAR